MKTVEYSRIRFLSLSAVLILTAAPLGAQSVKGFRAGVAWARTDYSYVHFAPCLPETACHGVPSGRILAPLISADIRRPTAVEALSFRLSVSYGVKGGTGSGYWADATPSSGTLRLHFLQFSPLLNVNLRGRAQDRYAVSLLVGPWAALRIGCSVAGQLGTSCRSSEPLDAGVAFGGGVQYRVASNLTLTTESIYHWGILPQNLSGMTRIVAVQFGVTIHSR